MSFWSSFIKELKIASRGFYFYIEAFIALLILLLLLFVVPDNFNQKKSEYLFYDMPVRVQQLHLEEIESNDIDEKAEIAILDIDGEEKSVPLYVTEDKKVYLLDNKEDLIYMADTDRELAAVVTMDENYQFNYDYYLQGYESSKFKNMIQLLNLKSTDDLLETMESQKVRSLENQGNTLTDKENLLPTILVFNGALMGLFIIAAYIFLDKEEGVIKAFALSPSPVWQYLLSKISVILLITTVSSLIILIPIMTVHINYLLLFLLLLSSAFFSSSLGLVIASYYNNIIQAFGTIYAFMMLMLIPNIAYFMPTWNPSWVKWIPSYAMLEAFKSILLGSSNASYIIKVSASFSLIAFFLFLYANQRYKKDLVN